MEKYFVYAIESVIDGPIYVGLSKDVAHRLKEHNAGKSPSTKGFRPWHIVYVEEITGGRSEARLREKYYKSGCGKEELKAKIKFLRNNAS